LRQLSTISAHGRALKRVTLIVAGWPTIPPFNNFGSR